MKKLFLISIFASLLFFQGTARADELSASQLKLRTEIKSFLSEEGFMPEIDSDGDIKFKKEGDSYYVRVASSDESPMYVVLFKSFSNPDGYTLEQIQIASCELNKYKGVKVICWDDTFSIRSEMYVVSSEAFKYSFYKVMKQIANVEDDVMDEIKAVKTSGGSGSSTLSSAIPFLITEMKIGNTDENNEVIQEYGSVIYDYKTKYLSPQITITSLKTGTVSVNIKFYKDGVLKTGSSSPSGYSYTDSINIGRIGDDLTFNLSGWGSKTAGHWDMGDYRFEIWFGDYCLGSKDFKVY